MEREAVTYKRESDGAIQTIKEHSKTVAEIAAGFALDPYRQVVYNAGILHDIGKIQTSSQKQNIRNADVDDAACGALAARKCIADPAGQIIEYIIAGINSGIPDGGTKTDMPGEGKNGASLQARLKKAESIGASPDYRLLKKLREIDNKQLAAKIAQDCITPEQLVDKYAFIVRMCYSALADADALAEEQFCKQTKRKTLSSDFMGCLADIKKCGWDQMDVQKQAARNIIKPADIYTINMPAGKERTIAEMECALLTAVQDHKKRIIYVTPYNRLITQAADEIERVCCGHAHILRHQSTYDAEDDERLSSEEKITVQQALENWDADIIMTTMVQFFGTLFSNKREKLRKMHNMADSVLIFDEAHLLPVDFLQPCLQSVVYLTRYAGCKAIFSTSVMPDYGQFFQKINCPDVIIENIISERNTGRYAFRDDGAIRPEQLPEMDGNAKSALIIVNTREKAQEIYRMFSTLPDVEALHMSSFMTKIDIQAVVKRIKNILVNGTNNEKKFVVVSTPLPEKGFSFAFETVFREYTKLDDILRTGELCDCDGDQGHGIVHMFELEDSGEKEIIAAAITKSLLKKYSGNIACPECIKEYYARLFNFQKDEMTGNAMHNFCKNISSIPFASYDAEIIKTVEQPVVIPESDEARQLIERLETDKISRKQRRRLREYACSVPIYALDTFIQNGAVTSGPSGTYILRNMNFYDTNTGINSRKE